MSTTYTTGKTYTIEDREFTIQSLTDELVCSWDTAKRRLEAHTTLEHILKPVNNQHKQYIIEGQEIAPQEVMDEVGCKLNSAVSRLRNCQTLDELFRPLNFRKGNNEHGNRHNSELLDWKDPIFKLTYGKW
jgi:hypothetical protein